jgi:membrane dipeptidase
VQAFAIFVPDTIPEEEYFQVAKEQLRLFKKEIVEANEEIVHIMSKKDMDNLQINQKGAILTLEGCHPIGSDIEKLRFFIEEGVRLVGLTWNNANAVSGSCTENADQGLSEFGREVVQLLNDEQIMVDVSHLSVPGFFDVIKEADSVIASHSNVSQLTKHPRNLTDKQIDALIEKDGLMGITYVPSFLNESQHATVEDVMHHLAYVMNKEGQNILCLGSDFDGIPSTVKGLNTIQDTNYLIEQIEKTWPDNAEAIIGNNFYRKFPRVND